MAGSVPAIFLYALTVLLRLNNHEVSDVPCKRRILPPIDLTLLQRAGVLPVAPLPSATIPLNADWQFRGLLAQRAESLQRAETNEEANVEGAHDPIVSALRVSKPCQDCTVRHR
jgi:hypothetical protein